MCTKVIDLPHVQQKFDWDCGIACIEMILRKCMLKNFDEDLLNPLGKRLGFGTTVWTIDLANILTYFNVNSVYHTITCGVDPGYKSQEYYQACFATDEMRVNKLFESAQELGLKIVKGSVSVEDIFLKVDQGWIAIVLVDSTFLRCSTCKFDCWSVLTALLTENNLNGQYRGHFIILCGYDMQQNAVFYKNPSREETQCCASIRSFEAARHAYGTDDDIIFVDLTSTMQTKL